MNGLELTQFGFKWGPMEITRIADSNIGYWLEITTPYQTLTVRCSPQGQKMETYQESRPTQPPQPVGEKVKE